MNPTHAKRLQRLLAAAPYVVAITVLLPAIGLLLPLSSWKPPEINLNLDSQAEDRPRRPLRAAELAVIWRRDLRQTLFDAPPVKSAAVEEPKLAIELVGTALEAERGFGVFRLPDNRTVVKPVGAFLEGFEVIAVQRGLARLRNGSREYELKVSWYERIKAAGGD